MGSLEKFLGKPKEIEIDGKKTTIQPLKVKDMARFSIKDPTPEQESELSISMVNLSIPDTTKEEIEKLPLSVFLQLIEAISKFNGFTDERAAKITEAIKRRQSGK